MQTLVDLAASIVAAHLANNRVAAGDVPGFLIEVHNTLTALTASEGAVNATARRSSPAQPQLTRPASSDANGHTGDGARSGAVSDVDADNYDTRIAAAAPPESLVPAVPIEDSIHPDRIVCLEDGANVILLKRHLRTNYQMTPDQYRRRWNLPMDYPMAAPNYAEQKRRIALREGFGRTVRPPSKGGVAQVAAKRASVRGPSTAAAIAAAPVPEKQTAATPAVASKRLKSTRTQKQPGQLV